MENTNDYKKLKEILGASISNRRKALGLSQENLAEMVNIEQQSLSRMESGKISPKMERLPLFADALKCRVIDLFIPQNELNTPCASRLTELIQPLNEEERAFLLSHIENLTHFLISQKLKEK